MLRRACYLVSRVAAWRSVLVLLCVSHAAPWSLVEASIINEGAPLPPAFNANNAPNNVRENLNQNSLNLLIAPNNGNNNNNNKKSNNHNLGNDNTHNGNNMKANILPVELGNSRVVIVKPHIESIINKNAYNPPRQDLKGPGGGGVNHGGEGIWQDVAKPLESQHGGARGGGKNVAAGQLVGEPVLSKGGGGVGEAQPPGAGEGGGGGGKERGPDGGGAAGLMSPPGMPGESDVAMKAPANTLLNQKYDAMDGQNDNNNNHNRGDGPSQLSWRRRRKQRKPGVVAPPSRPDMDMKKHVSWFENSRMYAFRASPDSRLLIRHAPIPAAGSPWPLPQHYYPEDAVFMLRAENFQFHAIGEICDILDFQFERIRRNTFGDEVVVTPEAKGAWGGSEQQGEGKFKEIRYVNVTILKECPKFPSLNDDESYDLEIKRSGASIIAREVWGAVRGLETFSQLIFQDEKGRYLINRTLINDFPRFPHRGILLDTSRHYLNKETLISNLEAMAQNKMNVFHWHITDDQSFPFESKTFPNLTKKGAYDAHTHIYTHETIAEIIEEARLRGIRVIPEFDTPGHTLSWGFGQDYLLTPCYEYASQPNGLFGPINPILKSTYVFLQRFFREVLAVFKDKYIHLGGDEVPFDCWESNLQIINFIKRNNLTDIRDVLGLYERKLLEIVTQLGKGRSKGSGYIVWQEVVDNGVNVKADTIVQVWMGDAFDVERIINMGLRVIYSTCWYLDYINYGQDWDKYYRCEQLDQLQNFQLKNLSLLLGGEAALWTEYADDENIISRLWPRASAAAERLWSNKNVKDEVAAASRIEEQRCRMLRRGLKVGVLSGPGHCPLWSRKGQPQRPRDSSIFSWSSHNDEMQFRSNYPQVYVVDMNAMYLVPVLVVICICCLTLIMIAQDSKSKIVAILSYPVGGSSKMGVKGLMYIFMAFVFAWCIWTAPIWMNSWETSANKARPVTVNGGY